MFWHPSKVSFIAKSHLFLKDLDFIWCKQWCSKINKGQSFSALLISKSFQIIFIPYQTKLSVRKPQPLFFLCISDKYNQPRKTKMKWVICSIFPMTFHLICSDFPAEFCGKFSQDNWHNKYGARFGSMSDLLLSMELLKEHQYSLSSQAKSFITSFSFQRCLFAKNNFASIVGIL